VPAASSTRISSSRVVSCSARPGTRRDGISPRARHGILAAEGSQELGQVAGRDAAGSGLLGPAGSDQAAQQRAL
jgi:hypothetical protein